MNYNLLIFDADGTLFDFDKTEKLALKNTFLKNNLGRFTSDKIFIYQKVNKQIWKEFEDGQISAEKLKVERFKRFLHEIGKPNISPSQVSDGFLFYLSQNSDLLPGAENLLTELSMKFRLVLMTNGLTKVQKPRFANSSIAKYFELLIISEEIGLAKPNHEIFDYTFQKLNFTDKSKTLIIGDNLSSDIQGGINFGIDSCWFNSKKKENNSTILPTYQISKLYQLKKILF